MDGVEEGIGRILRSSDSKDNYFDYIFVKDKIEQEWHYSCQCENQQNKHLIL